MKKILAAALLAAIAGVFATESKAGGWGAGIPELQAAKPNPNAGGPPGDRYGYNPFLRHMMWWKKDRCSPGGCGAPAGMGGPAGFGMPGGGGTMVFPNNPYIRSPRDWFQN